MASHPGAGALYFIGRCSTGAPREGPPGRQWAGQVSSPYGVSRSTSSTGQWSLPVTSLWMI